MVLSGHGNIVPASIPRQALWNLVSFLRPVQVGALCSHLYSSFFSFLWTLSRKENLESVCALILHTSRGFLSLSLSLRWAQDGPGSFTLCQRPSLSTHNLCSPDWGTSFFCCIETLLAQLVFSWRLVFLRTLLLSFPEGPRLLGLKIQEKTMSSLPQCNKKCNIKAESGVTQLSVNKSYQLIFENSSLTKEHRG